MSRQRSENGGEQCSGQRREPNVMFDPYFPDVRDGQRNHKDGHYNGEHRWEERLYKRTE